MNEPLVCEGLPPLIRRKNVTSFFEFWPSQIIYIPVVFQWLFLSLKYKNTSLPLLANPTIPLAGMVGESKSEILSLAGAFARQTILPWVVLERTGESVERQLELALAAMQSKGFNFPVVAKPDKGCRGSGVWKVSDRDRLLEYIARFPRDSRFLLQRLSSYQAEAGVFYIRHPAELKGRILSITLKYPPQLLGDGKSTLRQLLLDDERASRLTQVYFPRLKPRLDDIIAAGERVPLVFAGNHCRGCQFRNGNAYITPALTESLDRLLKDVSGFHYGRLDLRFKDMDALREGRNLEIIEINGAASEATHIWDPDTRLTEVYEALFHQYRTLFEIGHYWHQRGMKPAGLFRLLQAWWQERKLVSYYPPTD